MTDFRLWLEAARPLAGRVHVVQEQPAQFRVQLMLSPDGDAGKAEAAARALLHSAHVADMEVLDATWSVDQLGLLLDVSRSGAEDVPEVAAALGLRQPAATWQLDGHALAAHLQHGKASRPSGTGSPPLPGHTEPRHHVLPAEVRQRLQSLPEKHVQLLVGCANPGGYDLLDARYPAGSAAYLCQLTWKRLALDHGSSPEVLRTVDAVADLTLAAVHLSHREADPLLLERLFPRTADEPLLLTSEDPRLGTARPAGTPWAIGRSSAWVTRRLAIEREVARWEAQTLEGSVEHLVAAALPERPDLAPILALRYGADGRGVITLDAVGQMVKLTRERIRQLQSKAEKRLPEGQLVCPPLTQMLQVLDHALPCTAPQLAELMRQGALTRREAWTATALRSVAALFGQTLAVTDVGSLVVRDDDVAVAQRTLATARRLSGFSGVTSVASVRQDLGDSEASDELVRAVLQVSGDVHWLDEENFWTDHPEGRNRLVNTCLRIVTVISPQSLDDVHEGVLRNFSWRASTGGGRFDGLSAPGHSVLRDFLDSHPAFQIDGADMIAAVERPALDLLGPEKLAMTRVLLAAKGHVMHRNQLMAASAAAGVNPATAGVFTTYGEIFKRFAPNVWGLRGAPVTPSDIQRVTQVAKDDREDADDRAMQGATASGRPWTARVITPTFRYSGVLTAEWGGTLLQERALRAVDALSGEDAGMLRWSGTFNYGYSTLLSRHRPEIGSVIRVTADLEDDFALVEFGGEELLDEPFDW
jgi:hypothetical protein